MTTQKHWWLYSLIVWTILPIIINCWIWVANQLAVIWVKLIHLLYCSHLTISLSDVSSGLQWFIILIIQSRLSSTDTCHFWLFHGTDRHIYPRIITVQRTLSVFTPSHSFLVPVILMRWISPTRGYIAASITWDSLWTNDSSNETTSKASSWIRINCITLISQTSVVWMIWNISSFPSRSTNSSLTSVVALYRLIRPLLVIICIISTVIYVVV